MRRTVPLVVGAVAALTTQAANAVAALRSVAATPKKVTIVKKTVTGSEGSADRWGYVKITLVVRKTTTTVGTKKTVKRRIVGVGVPEYPNHTDRSVFINQQALPYLVQEVLQAQMSSKIQLISGATDTSYGFIQSLQAAILKARKV